MMTMHHLVLLETGRGLRTADLRDTVRACQNLMQFHMTARILKLAHPGTETMMTSSTHLRLGAPILIVNQIVDTELNFTVTAKHLVPVVRKSQRTDTRTASEDIKLILEKHQGAGGMTTATKTAEAAEVVVHPVVMMATNPRGPTDALIETK